MKTYQAKCSCGAEFTLTLSDREWIIVWLPIIDTWMKEHSHCINKQKITAYKLNIKRNRTK